MLDRKSLVSTIWLTPLLALLAGVLLASIWASGFVTVSSQLDGVEARYTSPPDETQACLVAGTATDTFPQAKAIASEDEEQERTDALDEPQLSSLIPSSFRKIPGRRSIAPRPIPSLYPLRC